MYRVFDLNPNQLGMSYSALYIRQNISSRGDIAFLLSYTPFRNTLDASTLCFLETDDSSSFQKRALN